MLPSTEVAGVSASFPMCLEKQPLVKKIFTSTSLGGMAMVGRLFYCCTKKETVPS